jgi:hypothetical protein
MAKSHDEQCPPGQSLVDFKLDLILKKIGGIEDCLFGDDAGRDGLKLDVDRLKRSRATHNAVLWVIFTTLLGVAGTVIASMIGGG